MCLERFIEFCFRYVPTERVVDKAMYGILAKRQSSMTVVRGNQYLFNDTKGCSRATSLGP
jgi:hypothetical protein